MNKPKKHKRKYFDYIECSKFLEQKYGYDERDYANSSYDKRENKFINETGNIRPSYYSVGKNKPNQYAYPIDDSPDWKYFFDEKEVSIDEWKIAKDKYDKWEEKFQSWQDENPRPPYQDFWNWICDTYDITNGCSFTFDESYPPYEDWQKEIFYRYMDEFGTGETGHRTIDFEVNW